MSMQSVFLGTDCELLPHLFAFYAGSATEVRDVTANTRKMWKGVELSAANVRYYDVDPTVNPDVVCSFDALPDPSGSVSVLVYDPPHLPVAAASQASHKQMVSDYGLALSPKGDNVSALHPGFLSEAKRVLRPDGLVFAKIKDYVHNHKYQWNCAEFVALSRAAGLTPCDLIIKRDPCGGNLKSGRWQKSHHARNVHCYWIVLRNGRCEPKSR
jgi:hypothetical protein